MRLMRGGEIRGVEIKIQLKFGIELNQYKTDLLNLIISNTLCVPRYFCVFGDTPTIVDISIKYVVYVPCTQKTSHRRRLTDSRRM